MSVTVDPPVQTGRDLPMLSVRVVEHEDGKKYSEVLDGATVLGFLPVERWGYEADSESLGKLTLTLHVDQAAIQGGTPEKEALRVR